MSAVPWNSISETWTNPLSRPSSKRSTLSVVNDPDDVKTKADRDNVATKVSPEAKANPDDVKTKVSGHGNPFDALPDSQAVPDSVQITADASGPRLMIPALSLRKAIAGLDDLPEQEPEDVSDIAQTIARPLSESPLRTGEVTDTVPRRRPWFKSSFVVYGAALAMIAGGLLASTTDTAEMIAARLHMLVFQSEAEVIPAAAADSLPAAMPPVQQAAPQAAAPAPPAPSAVVEAEKPAAAPSVAPAKAGPKPLRTVPARSSAPARRLP